MITVSILGLGWRGGETYGRYMDSQKDKFSITNICTTNKQRLNKYGKIFNVDLDHRFLDDNEFLKEKRSDLLVIASPDKKHIEHAFKATELGYDILLEKPICENMYDMLKLLELSKKVGNKIMVCHVLRYTAMIQHMKKLLDSGMIGDLIAIDHIENVSYWHYAHAYVRGNWRNTRDSATMLLAKSCHDLDLIQYFANSKCKSVASMGDLRFFKKENQPKDASDRCLDCNIKEDCPYNAYKIYVDSWINNGRQGNVYPQNVVYGKIPLTEVGIREELNEGKYGRCVFACDNNVVDNQLTIMRFENGITATLRVMAFTQSSSRNIRLFGTLGEIELDEEKDKITLKTFNGENEEWAISELSDDLSGHSGGDVRMIDALYDAITNNTPMETSLENSLESHLIALSAENSRENNCISHI